MSLSIDSSPQGQTSTEMKGVFIHESLILSASDLSGQDIKGRTYDLALDLELSTEYSWTRKVTIKRNFKYDSQNPNQVADWGGAFVIRDLFKSLGFFDGLTKEEVSERLNILQMKKIPADFMAKLHKKKVFVLVYAAGYDEAKGKKKYKVFSQISLDREKLLSDFKAGIAKGFPDDYSPESMDLSGSADFNYGANTVSQDAESSYTKASDDDGKDFSF